jgi:hypothetical protein
MATSLRPHKCPSWRSTWVTWVLIYLTHPFPSHRVSTRTTRQVQLRAFGVTFLEGEVPSHRPLLTTPGGAPPNALDQQEEVRGEAGHRQIGGPSQSSPPSDRAAGEGSAAGNGASASDSGTSGVRGAADLARWIFKYAEKTASAKFAAISRRAAWTYSAAEGSPR